MLKITGADLNIVVTVQSGCDLDYFSLPGQAGAPAGRQAARDRGQDPRARAAGPARHPLVPAYTDVTVSFYKSVSLLHGSIRENAARARDERDARFCEILQEANAAAMAHLQTWGRGDTHRLSRPQRRSPRIGPLEARRAGRHLAGRDMHDHNHNPVLQRARTLSNGKWSATDTMAIRARSHRQPTARAKAAGVTTLAAPGSLPVTGTAMARLRAVRPPRRPT